MKARFAGLLGLSLMPVAGIADDGWVANSGAPHIMKGHPTIRMQSERVFMMLARKYTDVDAHFHFVNDGPATTVRIGFPDGNSSSIEEEIEPGLMGFHSWVGGKPVKTRHVLGTTQWWYVKSVRFPAHTAIDIRDRYRVKTGLEAFSDDRYTSTASYELDTGASWKGKIDRAEIILEIAPSLPKVNSLLETNEQPYVNQDETPTKGLHAASLQTPADVKARRNRKVLKAIQRYRHVAWVSGMSAPHLRNGRIVLVRDHFKPTGDDNLVVFFNAGKAFVPDP